MRIMIIEAPVKTIHLSLSKQEQLLFKYIHWTHLLKLNIIGNARHNYNTSLRTNTMIIFLLYDPS